MKTIYGVTYCDVVAIDKAAKFIGCSKVALANAIGVTKQTFNSWMQDSKIPLDKALEVHVITKGEILVAEIAPKAKNLMDNVYQIDFQKRLQYMQENPEACKTFFRNM